MNKLLFAIGLTLAATTATAELRSKISASNVEETMSKLEAAVETAGATIFAKVDHAAGAEQAGLELPPAQLLIFGNPQLGTPAMQDDPLAGLALPLRVLVFENADQLAVVAWETPDTFLDGLQIPEDAEYRMRMAQALENLTDAAVAD